MDVRVYHDPDTGRPHCEAHGVSAREATEALARSVEEGPGRDGTRSAIGSTTAGRLLRLIFVREVDGSIFLITAYDVTGRARQA